MGTGVTERSLKTHTFPGVGAPDPTCFFKPGSLQGTVPKSLPRRTSIVTPSHYSKLCPRLLPSRSESPEPQEFSRHPRLRPPGPGAPWRRQAGFPRGFRLPDPGTLHSAPPDAVISACHPGPCGPGSPEGRSALSASARFRKAVEATPLEAAAAAAGAGESRSRSQRAGASAPFPGCGVIHPPGRGGRYGEARAPRSRAVLARTCRTGGSNLPKDPAGQYPSFPRPFPFIYIPSSPAANQKEEGATRSQSGSGGGSIARPLSFSNRRLG